VSRVGYHNDVFKNGLSWSASNIQCSMLIFHWAEEVWETEHMHGLC
jgi:hypothetical protein